MVSAVSGSLGAPPVLAASLGAGGAVAAAGVLTYAPPAVRWWRGHPATVGVAGICLLYLAFGLVLAWLRWGA